MKNTRRRSVSAGESEAPEPEKKVVEEMENGGEEEEDEMENEVEEEAKPELPEGFFEIEHIRRKRVKKGEVQYLVKWRGWPESANTWEPVEHLEAVPDVVDAFEQRQSGKHKSSKRKGRPGGSTSQAKRRQSTAPTVSVDLVQDHSPIPYNNGDSLNNGMDTNMGGIHISETVENNGSGVLSSQVQGAQEQNGGDANHSETINEAAGNLGVDMQGWRAPEVNDHARDGEDSAHAGHSISRRKKSAVVKRFRKDETDCRTNHTMSEDSVRVTRSRLQAEQQRQKNPVDESGTHDDAAIVQIIKPMSFEASGPDQDVVVTFTARRSDGKEIIVDNKFLKVNNPLMLINFYEKHLKYNADMEAQT
ncbi:hypothetical protein DCAR_0934071 [Daucus carota subsp. sativus]|uniref:Chromo domain-containing protein n=1 Tax=Daucus carota subsp. sativus TaxID=79200 RepID=A0AAF0XWA6_DAUCS|nr:PREDICTED: chromo domain-containing protein LHP1-like [Daucus carota subsp. sativus]WOH14552.1 hypothetical protein DCAR_0934071 [Daucus carota subsp. sativus]